MNIPTKNEIIKINKNTWGNDFIIYELVASNFDSLVDTQRKPSFGWPVYTKIVTSMIVTEIKREPYDEIFRTIKRIPGRSGVVLTNSATGVRRVEVKGVLISNTREENINKINSLVSNITGSLSIANGLKVICFPDVSPEKGQFGYLESAESDINECNGKVVEISLSFVLTDFKSKGISDWLDTSMFPMEMEI